MRERFPWFSAYCSCKTICSVSFSCGLDCKAVGSPAPSWLHYRAIKYLVVGTGCRRVEQLTNGRRCSVACSLISNDTSNKRSALAHQEDELSGRYEEVTPEEVEEGWKAVYEASLEYCMHGGTCAQGMACQVCMRF